MTDENCAELKAAYCQGLDAVEKYYSSHIGYGVPDDIGLLIGEYCLPDLSEGNHVECRDKTMHWYVSQVMSHNDKKEIDITYIDRNSGRIAELGTFTDGRPYGWGDYKRVAQ
jgi:hypothetical protein